MSEAARLGGETDAACERCLRRAWLLGQLTGPLDRLARDRTRLLAALDLDDGELIAALAGRRRTELIDRHAAFEPAWLGVAAQRHAICRHAPHLAPLLSPSPAPRALFVAGARDLLAGAVTAPAVAIVGSSAPSDYGLRVTAMLARGLAAAGIAVAALPRAGVASGAVRAAEAAGGATLMVSGDGVRPHRFEPAGADARGCAVSEAPASTRGRLWGALAAQRLLAELTSAIVVVEAREHDRDALMPAALAQALGRTVAAVPGRVSSPLAGGANALLAGGARLVRDPGDVLELLGPSAGAARCHRAAGPEGAERDLGGRLASALDHVACGRDTPDDLVGAGMRAEEALAALGELELRGLIARGASGRYTPTGTPSYQSSRAATPAQASILRGRNVR